MKSTKYLIAILALALVSCKDDEAPIGEPFSKIEGLTATDWEFEQAFIIDLGNPANPERDVTSFYTGGAALRLSFDADGSFTSIAGEGVNPFPESGTWSFHPNNETPREIRVDDGTRVVTMPLAGPTRISDPQLGIRFTTRECTIDGELKPVVGYRFVFNRAN